MITEIELPEDWRIVNLGTLGEVLSGLTYSPDDISSEGTLVLRSSNIQERVLAFEDNVYVNSKNFKPVTENDILICVRNGSKSLIGKNALISKEAENYAFGAFMAVYRSEYNNYLYQLFDTDFYKREIHRNLGATINSINGSDLKRFQFPLPPLPEQKAIAKVLGAMDKAINTSKQLVKQKELSKKWLMQNLLTGKKRLKGFSGEWKELRFGEFLQESRIKGCTGDVAKKITVKLYGNGVFAKKDKTKGSKNTQYFIRKSGQLIYSKLDFLNGAFGIIPLKLNNYESTLDLPCFDIENSKINKYYLLSLVSRKDFYKKYDDGAIGGRKAKRIQVNEFLNIEPLLPTIDEQTAISQILQAADKEIKILKTKTEKLKEQKKGMMQVLLTGKKRLNLDLKD